MIKTIVVPTDGSGQAMKAVALAADLASKYKAKVVLIHVLMREATPTAVKQIARGMGLPAKTRKELDRLEAIPIESAAFAGAYTPVAIPVPDSVLAEIGGLIMEKARRALAIKRVKNVTARLVTGNAADAIVAAAKKEKADMIVMGSRGFSDIKGLLLGSVSHKVSHLASCTCVTVK
jgi:nucleotide-binding universal stress UspA family protein